MSELRIWKQKDSDAIIDTQHNRRSAVRTFQLAESSSTSISFDLPWRAGVCMTINNNGNFCDADDRAVAVARTKA